MIPKHIPASVLPTVMILALVVCIIVMITISLFDIGSQFSEQYITQWQRKADIESAKLLYEKGLITDLENDSTIVKLYQNEPQSDITVSRANFGLYKDITFTSADHATSIRLIMGARNDYEYGLFYAENNYTVTLAGNTNIRGVVSLPAAGATYAQENNIDFNGEKINEDNSITSNPIVERPTKEALNLIETIFSNAADRNIELTKDDQQDNTVIIAQNIIVRSGFVGSPQMFAKDSLIIESDVKLKRGAGLFCKGYIDIGNNVKIDGYIISFTDNIEKDDISLKISDSVFIRGFVYCDGIAELSGQIDGVALIQRSRHYTDEGFYEDLIHNLTIKNNPAIAMPQWTNQNNTQTRVKLFQQHPLLR